MNETIARLQDDNERLKRELFRAKERAQYLESRCVAMDVAIRRALADSESGNGWGPDVTVCQYLRDALVTPNVEFSGSAVRRRRPAKTDF